MDRRLAVRMPAEFASGVRCSVGAALQVPLTIEATGVRACEVTVRAEGDVLERRCREIELDPEETITRLVVLELRPRHATTEPLWVVVEVVGDNGLYQATGFLLEVAPGESPDALGDPLRRCAP